MSIELTRMKRKTNGSFSSSPFVKWAGGKGQLLAQYSRFFPQIYENYIEPFVGGGDYGLVNAYIVANNYTPGVINYARQQGIKSYITPRRPYRTRQWKQLTLVQYAYTGGKPAVSLKIFNS